MLSQYTNLYFPICSLVVSLVIFIMFFSKKKIKTKETNLYSKLVIVGLCESFLYTFICFIAHFVDISQNYIFFVVLNKLLYIIYIIWFTLLFSYIVYLYLSGREKSKLTYLSNSILLCIVLSLITVLSILKVNIYYDSTTGLSNSYGPSANFLFVAIGGYIVSMIIMAILDIKNNKHKKYIPLYLLFILMIIAMIIRYYDPLFSIYSNVLSLTLLIMYFTIENPDLKMLEEIYRNRELVEKSNEEKLNTLFKISQDVREPLLEMEELSNNIARSNVIDEMHKDARYINTVSKNTYDMVNNVLNISVFDTHDIKIVNSSYNIYSLFSQIVSLVKNKIDKGVDFKYSIKNTIPDSLHGDYLKLKQVICSVLLNSFEHTEKGFVDLDIDSIVKYDVCRLIITISDSGRGIDLDKINEILSDEEELTEKELKKLNDFDVNLKITKKIVNILGGTLLIKSEKEKGSTFTIILNQRIENYDNCQGIKSFSHTISNKKRIMIVNDDYKELEVISTLFKKNNCEVFSVLYSLDCVERIRNGEKYDLVLIDDEMASGNAVEVIKELEKIDKDVKVIVMLDSEKEFIKDNYLQDYSFSDYFLKRIYKEEVKRIIEKNF